MLRTLGVFAACLSKASDGKMPADHETIRIWGLTGGKTQKDFFLFREVLGGGGPGRPWADGSDVVHIVPNSRNLPAEFSETRYPIMIDKLSLKKDSGGAGFRRGGLGYDKEIRLLEECRLISNADRSILGCYGVNGGLAGNSYNVSVIRENGEKDNFPGMTDTEVLSEGCVVNIVTTGGGGWGNPLAREVERVIYDLQCGIISKKSAEVNYGVIANLINKRWVADIDKTNELRNRAKLKNKTLNMFDRGDGFKTMEKKDPVKYPPNWKDPLEGWFAKN